MIPAGNLLFAKVKIPILDKKLAVKQIEELNMQGAVWNAYRNTYLTTLMGKNQNPEWTEYAPKSIVEWAEEVLFPFIGMRSRITIIHTLPNTANNEHIDCSRRELNTLQHKFRIVLQGEVSTLYFITKNGNQSPPMIDEGFIMDGGWPHGMNNTSNETKLTLALGFPWIGKEQYDDNVELLMNRNDYEMPDDIDHLWEK